MTAPERFRGRTRLRHAVIAVALVGLGGATALTSAGTAGAGSEWAASEARRVDAPGRAAFADGRISRSEYEAAFERTLACLRESGFAPIETSAPGGIGLHQYSVPSSNDAELRAVDDGIERCGSPLRPIEAAFVASATPAPGSAARRQAERRARACMGSQRNDAAVEAIAADLMRTDPGRVGGCIAEFQAAAPLAVPGAESIAASIPNR